MKNPPVPSDNATGVYWQNHGHTIREITEAEFRVLTDPALGRTMFEVPSEAYGVTYETHGHVYFVSNRMIQHQETTSFIAAVLIFATVLYPFVIVVGISIWNHLFSKRSPEENA